MVAMGDQSILSLSMDTKKKNLPSTFDSGP